MKRHRLAAVCILLLVVATGSPVGAQQSAESLPLGVETIDIRNHPDISLTVTVPADLGGDLLPAEAFTVTEDGEAVAASVTRVPTQGLHVVLLIDTSGSMAGEPLEQAKAAASSFIGQMPDDVDLAVTAFGEEAAVVAGFGSDRTSVLEAVAQLEPAGETALYDGLITGTSIFAEQNTTEAGRRVLVLLSDGGDTASATRLEDAIVAVLGVDAGFYAVELQTPENDHEALERLALATAGAVVPADDPAALQGVFAEVGALIVNQYDVSFTSQANGATELAVSVTSGGVVAAMSRPVRYPELLPPPPPPEPTPPPAPVAEPVAEPEAVPVTAPTFTVSTRWVVSRQAMLIGLITLFFALALAFVLLGRSGNKARLVASDVRKLMKTRERTKLATFTEHLSQMAERTLERGGRRSSLEAALEAAGSPMRVGEFVVLGASIGLVSFFAMSTLLNDLFFGMLAAGLALWVSVTALYRKGRLRQAAFAEQLVGTLQLMSGSLRAGFGLLQAIDVVAEEAPSPTSDEFHRVKVETHLGRDLDEALEALAERVGGDDFEWVVEAVRIHREIGGDLADIFDTVAETVRERTKLRRQVKALSAEGRLSAVFLVLLPIVMVILISITNPGYLAELTNSSGGRVAIGIGVALMAVGVGWMRRITQVEI